MQLSAIGQACLIAREGRRLVAYRDTVGVWTIGIGCTEIDGRRVRPGETITAAECDALFADTWPRYAAAVGRALPARAGLADHEADALISFCYNVGTAAFAGSRVAAHLRAGERGAVPAAMLLWRKPAAILTRRQAEADQFATPYTRALPQATARQRPVAVPVAAGSGGAAHPAQAAPVIVPVSLPARASWREAFGAWIARALAPAGGTPEGAARG